MTANFSSYKKLLDEVRKVCIYFVGYGAIGLAY